MSGSPGAADGDAELTLQEAADLLGVHYMTAYRYVRTGRLAATQTSGKWHVTRAGIAALDAPGAVGRSPRGATPSREHYARQLSDRLVQGDEAEAWRVTQLALAAGCSAEDLYLEVLGPALCHVGDEWAAGRVSVAQEHRASALTSRLIGRLGPLFIRRGRKRGNIVLGALPDDFHALASAFVADVLRGRGFAVADLGANTPPASFVEAIAADDRIVAVGIVVSAPIGNAAIAKSVAEIKTATDAPILLGGTMIRDATHARRLGADASTNSAAAAADWFEAAARG